MSHKARVNIVSDQEINIGNEMINIHNIDTIYVSSNGIITNCIETLDKEIAAFKALKDEKKTMKEPVNNTENIISTTEEVNMAGIPR